MYVHTVDGYIAISLSQSFKRKEGSRREKRGSRLNELSGVIRVGAGRTPFNLPHIEKASYSTA